MKVVLNSSPLCYVYDNDLSEPLTPSHLIFGRRLNNRNVINSEVKEQNPSTRVKHIQYLLTHFWKRFASEYLTELREREKFNKREDPKITVGDVLIINQKHAPRCSWRLGKVLRLIKSPDGSVRGAELKSSKGGTLCRPLTMLHPLEITSNENDIPETQSNRTRSSFCN